MSQSTTFPTAPHSEYVGWFGRYDTGAYVVGAYDLADLVGTEGAARHPWKLDETAGLVMVWFVPARPSKSAWDLGPWTSDQYLVRYRLAGEYSAREVAWSSEPTVAEVARAAREALTRHDQCRACRGECDTLTPGRDAEESAGVFFRTHRLSVADLLRDPDFLRLARQAAECGKKFTAELLQWERKPVVMEAVAIVAAEVEAERADKTARLAAEAQTAEERRRREKPTRDAVLEAYGECGYRTCSQGHTVTVRIGEAPGASSDVSKGEAYSSLCTWRKQDSTHTLAVRADWLERVELRGLSTFDGKLCLDATLLGHTAGHEALYSLLLVRQGRGTSLETETVRVALTATGEARAVPARELATCTEYTDERIAHDALIDAGLVG